MQPEFHYTGSIPASKSLANRWLIIQSFAEALAVQCDAQCADVHHMRAGLRELAQGSAINCGDGGTTLRFLTLRAARIPGQHILTGTQRLFSRPQQELIHCLTQLGIDAHIPQGTQPALTVTSKGWHTPTTLTINAGQSSQFASAVILSAWDLEQELVIALSPEQVSSSYLAMTLATVRSAGMQYTHDERRIIIPPHQRVSAQAHSVEPDLSSTFAVLACAAVAGSATLHDIPTQSLQPDHYGITLLKRMGAAIMWQDRNLVIKQPTALQAIEVDLGNCPDLFPVLALLCAHAQGTSRLYGAPQLQHKESQRITKVSELLTLMRISHQTTSDGMIIHGCAGQHESTHCCFDADHDHRMVMAATLAQLMGHEITIAGGNALDKSFPEFREIIRNQ